MSLTWDDLGGGVYANPKLSEEAEFIATKNMALTDILVPAGSMALGKNSGDSVATKLWGRLAGVSTSPLSENVRVPMATPPEYTVQTTVYQRGISVPWTKYRQDLDRLSVEEPVIHALGEHYARTKNTLVYNEAVAGRSFCYVPLTASTGNFTDNGSPTGTAAANLGGFHIREIVRHLRRRNTPEADGKNFVGVFSPTLHVGLYNDTQASGFVDVQKYTSSADGLIKGEVGKYFNVRLTEDNDVLPDAIGSGSAFGSGFIFGLDAIREITASPMELVAQMNFGGDFGRQRAIAWLSIEAMKVVWNYTSHGEGRVCHITTA